MNWTAKQEKEFQDARERADELSAARTLAAQAAIAKVQEALSGCLREYGDGLDYSEVILNADAIRDALAPFDSGVRQEKP